MEQGIHNAEVIDEVAYDPDNEELALIMRATQNWQDDDARIEEMKEKVSCYIEFALGGQMMKSFPDRAEGKVRIQLDCKYIPTDKVMTFLEGVNEVVMKAGLRSLKRESPHAKDVVVSSHFDSHRPFF